jgi:phosphate transport system permease protein
MENLEDQATEARIPVVPPPGLNVMSGLASAHHEAVADSSSVVRDYLRQRSGGRLADKTFAGVMLACALSIFGIVALIVFVLVRESQLSIHAFGWKFFVGRTWNPVLGSFGALPFLFGTLLSSLLAVCIAVPLSLSVAIFLLEVCPQRLRSPIAFLTELLAAIPSVVYGLWAIFVLVPIVRDQAGPVFEKYLGWTGFFDEPNFGFSVFTAGIVLAIMIFPIISSISRDVMRSVPVAQREGALALGATRWEMLRMAVLRNSRLGIVGAVILGLGRALGETMAVTMVIGNHAGITRNLFAPGYTLASVIANEFSEASGDLYLSALIEIGLALFLVTIVVNAVARLLVWFVTRGETARHA